MMLGDRLLTLWRSRDPAWCAVLVLEVITAENGFEHTLLVAHDQLVFQREQQHCKRKKPEHPRNGDATHPDEKVADVKRVSHPGEDSVRDEPLHIARPAAGHGAGGSDAGKANRFPDQD